MQSMGGLIVFEAAALLKLKSVDSEVNSVDSSSIVRYVPVCISTAGEFAPEITEELYLMCADVEDGVQNAECRIYIYIYEHGMKCNCKPMSACIE